MDTIDKVPQTRLLKKGAEASLFITNWHNRKAVIKVRLPKRYRPAVLDARIRSYRTIHEPQLMHEAKTAGVATPLIYLVNVPESTIIMQYIEGKQVKELLNLVSKQERYSLCVAIGESVAKLHRAGLIHGDLTTSNLIQAFDGTTYFIDFGLGEKNLELEAQGVDLHLLKRALQSTHFQFWEDCFKAVLCGYTSVLGVEFTEKIYEKILEIERRGRYVEERKQ
ncbi:MAG: Kae1-associated serine/threonine protein kinase [Crenarchaeota archaeon]|jgi:TP53 regulating kinase-like protein|nr:Kae1-associated serine/threonine protein kinase [Thermoproteota archaeon]